MDKARQFADLMLDGFQAGDNISGTLSSRGLEANLYYDRAVAEILRSQPTRLKPGFYDEITSYVKDIMTAHNYRFVHEHTLRVRNLAVQIAPPTADLAMIEVACLLHDVAKPFGDDHASHGAKMAQEWLIKGKFGGHQRIAQWIREHNSTPTELESEVLFDADKLDKIGISGVCILLAKAYLKKLDLSQLIHIYRTDEELPVFFGKHKIGSEKFYTENAKRLVLDRLKVMDSFFSELDA